MMYVSVIAVLEPSKSCTPLILPPIPKLISIHRQFFFCEMLNNLDEMFKYKITSYGTSQTFPLDLNEMK